MCARYFCSSVWQPETTSMYDAGQSDMSDLSGSTVLSLHMTHLNSACMQVTTAAQGT